MKSYKQTFQLESCRAGAGAEIADYSSVDFKKFLLHKDWLHNTAINNYVYVYSLSLLLDSLILNSDLGFRKLSCLNFYPYVFRSGAEPT